MSFGTQPDRLGWGQGHSLCSVLGTGTFPVLCAWPCHGIWDAVVSQWQQQRCWWGSCSWECLQSRGWPGIHSICCRSRDCTAHVISCQGFHTELSSPGSLSNKLQKPLQDSCPRESILQCPGWTHTPGQPGRWISSSNPAGISQIPLWSQTIFDTPNVTTLRDSQQPSLLLLSAARPCKQQRNVRILCKNSHIFQDCFSLFTLPGTKALHSWLKVHLKGSSGALDWMLGV